MSIRQVESRLAICSSASACEVEIKSKGGLASKPAIVIVFVLSTICFFSFVIETQAATCNELAGACKSACAEEDMELEATDCKDPTPKCCAQTCAELGGTCKKDCEKGDVYVAGAYDCDDPKTPNCCKAAPAAAPGAGSSITLKDPLKGIGLLGAINRLVTVFLGIVGALALLVFIYAGVIYMTAGGAEDRVTKAKDTMKYAIIGLAAIILAYVLTSYFFEVLTT